MERENTRTGGTSSQTLYKKWEKENIQKIAAPPISTKIRNRNSLKGTYGRGP